MPTPQKIGKYDILGVLGRGGMGVVYKAADPSLGRLVAIKMLTSGLADDPDFLKRFHREAQSTASLHHPNIVTVHDFGEQDGMPYLVMEYLEGESLETVITSRRQFTLLEKMNCMVQVCAGLQYAHEHRLIHRDIKPANIMLLDGQQVKLVDFGIARVGDEHFTRTGELVGTVQYMSPEQINGRPLDARTDIFATGVVLYRLLTNVLPFQGPDTAATLLKIIRDPPPPLPEFLQGYPPDLDEIVGRALAKPPSQRYQTAHQFGLALMQVQAQLRRQLVTARVREAQACIDQRQLSKAQEILLQAIEIDPHDQQVNVAIRRVQQLSEAGSADLKPCPSTQAEIVAQPAAGRTQGDETVQQSPSNQVVADANAPGERRAAAEVRRSDTANAQHDISRPIPHTASSISGLVLQEARETVITWFSVVTKGLRALERFDLDRSSILLFGLRFMLYMAILEVITYVPFLDHVTDGVRLVIETFLESLGVALIFQACMKLFGGRGSAQACVAGCCFLTSYLPVSAVLRLPTRRLLLAVKQQGLSIPQQVEWLRAHIAQLPRFDMVVFVATSAISMAVWLLFYVNAFRLFRSLHQLKMPRALSAFGIGVAGILLLGLILDPLLTGGAITTRPSPTAVVTPAPPEQKPAPGPAPTSPETPAAITEPPSSKPEEIPELRTAKLSLRPREGSELIGYRRPEFDEYVLPLGPPQSFGNAVTYEKSIPLEGQLSRYTYLAPAGCSAAELFRHYEQEFARLGIQGLYEKRAGEHGWFGPTFDKISDQDDLSQILSYNEAEERLMVGKSGDTKPTYYLVFVTQYLHGVIPHRLEGKVQPGRAIAEVIAIVPEAIHAPSESSPDQRAAKLVLRARQGSELIGYRQPEFDDYLLPLGPPTSVANPVAYEKSIPLQGRVSRYTYLAPSGCSAAELFQHYKQELERAGVATLYEKKAGEHGWFGPTFDKIADQDDLSQILAYDEAEERLVVGKGGDAKPVYYVVFVTQYLHGVIPHRLEGKVQPGRAIAELVVIAPDRN